MSELTLGTWGLSGDAYGKTDEAVAERVVRRALDVGITTFDTSDAYGGGRMEALLGRTLPKGADVVVITKGGVDRTTNPPRKCFDADYLERALRASLKRLGRDQVDVYLLHNPTVDAMHDWAATEAATALQRKGLVRHWGVSAGDVDVARAAIERGAEVVELAYNLFHSLDLHRLAGDVMVAQTGVLARSTLAYGLLAGLWTKDRQFDADDHRRGRWTSTELARRIEQLDSLRYLVKGDVLTLRAVALRFVLANHVVGAAVLGPRTVEQLEQLVREVGGGPVYLPDADLASLPRALSRLGIPT